MMKYSFERKEPMADPNTRSLEEDSSEFDNLDMEQLLYSETELDHEDGDEETGWFGLAPTPPPLPPPRYPEDMYALEDIESDELFENHDFHHELAADTFPNERLGLLGNSPKRSCIRNEEWAAQQISSTPFNSTFEWKSFEEDMHYTSGSVNRFVTTPSSVNKQLVHYNSSSMHSNKHFVNNTEPTQQFNGWHGSNRPLANRTNTIINSPPTVFPSKHKTVLPRPSTNMADRRSNSVSSFSSGNKRTLERSNPLGGSVCTSLENASRSIVQQPVYSNNAVFEPPTVYNAPIKRNSSHQLQQKTDRRQFASLGSINAPSFFVKPSTTLTNKQQPATVITQSIRFALGTFYV